jgi:hypothetical protein
VLERVFQRGNQTLILGKVVGLLSEVLAESGEFLPRLVFDDDSVAGRARISARASVAVGD